MITDFFRRRLIQPLMDLLRQGLSAEKLALSVSLGFVLGIFPMIGATTILCLVIGALFRVNQLAIQTVNYFLFPVQIAFYIPFFQMGAWLFGYDHFPFTFEEIATMLSRNPWQAIVSLWWANLRAITAWLLTAPLLGGILYLILVPVFKPITARFFPDKA
ncbi:DUF2062 domain-containing protein [bacterium]|nr:DUF2062 domain-containing protein [bacterium]NUN44171.1 DUF2062 domain-containing protein [bacterium]HMW33101.1 DUF2062 domain-containing protein [bacterium]HMW36901.1 DUF2062 domain-containing protein [bacterium]HMY36395.1 DUF2062 domain-containing protein [bacterium]